MAPFCIAQLANTEVVEVEAWLLGGLHLGVADFTRQRAGVYVEPGG